MDIKKKPRINQTIVLGAGASKSEGAPLQSELLSEFGVSKKQVFTNNLNKFEDLLFKYFNKFWGINSKNSQSINFPTFEECLGVLDLAYARGEGFRKTYRKNKIDKCRDALIYLIAEIIKNKLHEQVKYHNLLLNRLRHEDKLLNTAFISLNYDIIIDNELTNLYEEGYHLDYAVDFVNFHRLDGWEKPIPGKRVLLLKPHRSLDWVYCPICNHLELTPKVKGAIQAIMGEMECIECGGKLEPVIIPMTFFKEMNNPFIQQVYNKADEVLRSSDTIYFCGYSFPDADLHIKYLLKRAETFRGKTPDIYIINEHPGKTICERDDEITRYKRFFKTKSKVNYTKETFEEFCTDGI